ncbi:hypothetical protein [Bartonella sp. ML69XJBT]|uniref:hypothetical protein n=1 Tax=Bartonella sp. ML69XJBT TaxID=3019092 RepID=UPI002362DA0F|nr:hypothetical protein [Bartonella sp. ML69XJBT]
MAHIVTIEKFTTRIETEREEKLKEAIKIFATVFHSGGYSLYSFSKSVFLYPPSVLWMCCTQQRAAIVSGKKSFIGLCL